MKKESEYLLDEDYILHERVFYEWNYHKIFITILFLFIILGGLVFISIVHKWQPTECEMEIKEMADKTEDVGRDLENKKMLDEDYSFENRLSCEYISEADFYAICSTNENLGQELQYYINYIYARHGYVFSSGGEVDTLFKNNNWYKETPKKNEVTYQDFNLYEQANIDEMVKILIKEGFR